ncbi:MAG: hypothetical protein KAQ63_00085 [Candidatus Moranbacteria bacterium]|nr:hypothetical protein [Candidatus Moranbacteria bacterium]
MIEFLTQLGVAKQYAGDVWLLIIFLIIGLILTILVNKKNLGALILTVYISFAILSSSYFIPQTSGVKAILLGIIIFLVFNGVKRAFPFSVKSSGIAGWGRMIFLALVIVGMIGSIVLGWFSSEELEEFFTPLSRMLLISKEAHFVWSVLPFGTLIVLNNRRR